MNEDDINTLYNSMKNQETVIPQPERKSLWKYAKPLNTAYAMRNSNVCTVCDVIQQIGRKSTNEHIKMKGAIKKTSCKCRAVKVDSDDHKDMTDIVSWMSGRVDAQERRKCEEFLRQCSCKVCLSLLTNFQKQLSNALLLP